MLLTNNHGISLPLAVWLLHDEYDYINEPNYISATSFLKSIRQLVLSTRVNHDEREIDISAFIASRMGTAIHDSIQKTWDEHGRDGMRKLGYPTQIYDNIVVNPTSEQIEANPSIIPMWMEQRAFRTIEVNGVTYKIGGKFDMVLQGRLFDAKSTSVYSYLLGGKDDAYKWQGGIYRWLNPHLITEDHIFIQFIFTDWQRSRSRGDDNYPKTKVIEYPVALPSLDETEAFIREKLALLQRYKNAADEQIPHCTDEELWRSDPVFKYYADPAKANIPGSRSTKNFDDKQSADAFMASKGGKGIVKHVPGEVKACEYCPAFNVCKQKDLYFVS